MAGLGVIPRLYKLQVALSSLFGKKLYKDGRVENCKKENLIAIKEWYDDTRRYLPDRTNFINFNSSFFSLFSISLWISYMGSN